MHLFDIDIPGKQTFRESDTLTAGQALTVVDTAAGRLGIGICYDIRFQEMAMIYAQRGVQLIVYPGAAVRLSRRPLQHGYASMHASPGAECSVAPGAFNTTTGPAHWELLQRAQAVNNQLFVATCSPARDPDFSYQARATGLLPVTCSSAIRQAVEILVLCAGVGPLVCVLSLWRVPGNHRTPASHCVCRP